MSLDNALELINKGLSAAANAHPDPYLLALRDEAKNILASEKDCESVFDIQVSYGPWDTKDKKWNCMYEPKKRPTHRASYNFNIDMSGMASSSTRKVTIWRKTKGVIKEVEEQIKSDEPIIDIAVVHDKDSPLDGYIPLKSSIGGMAVTLNKARICIKYQDSKTRHIKPITAITATKEPAVCNHPILFRTIEDLASGSQPADLTSHEKEMAVFLGICRGSGPPVTRVGFVNTTNELLPPSGIQVTYTPCSSPANLTPQNAYGLYLCYQLDIAKAMHTAREAALRAQVKGKMLGIFGLLIGCLYSNYPQTVSCAMQNSRMASLPSSLFNYFIESLVQMVPCYVSNYSDSDRSEVAFFLGNILKTQYEKVPSELSAKIMAGILLLEGCNSSQTLMRHTSPPAKGHRRRRRQKCSEIYNLDTHRTRRSKVDVSLLSYMREGHTTFTSFTKCLASMVTSSRIKELAISRMKSNMLMDKDENFHPIERRTSDVKEIALTFVPEETTASSTVSKEVTEPKLTKAETHDVANSIVNSIVKNVTLSKRLASAEAGFLSSRALDFDVCSHIQKAVDTVVSEPLEKLFMTSLLVLAKQVHINSALAAKSAKAQSSYKEKNADSRERPVAVRPSDGKVSKATFKAIVNIKRLLEAGVDFIRATKARQYLFRRFLYVCLIELFACPWHPCFKAGLSLFLVLFHSYRNILPIEIGVTFDHIFIPALKSQNLTQLEKRIVLNVFVNIINSTNMGFIDLYYNCDNHPSWSCNTVISIFRALRSIILHTKGDGVLSMLNLRSQLEFTWLQEKALQVMGGLVEQILRFLCIDFGQEAHLKNSILKRHEFKAKRAANFKKSYEKYRKIYSSRDKDTQAKGVQKACKFLIKLGHSAATDVADFLFQYSDKMNHVQIADYLATGDVDDVFHWGVRECYMRKIDLTMVDFARAFRIFVCDCGFHVGGLEAQRLNRMSACFASVYLRDNPDSEVKSVYSGDALAQSLLFIHTIKFNKANETTSGPKLPELNEYISMMRGQNKILVDGKLRDADYSRGFLERQYREILSKEIKLKHKQFKPVLDQIKRHRGPIKTADRLRNANIELKGNTRRAYAILRDNAMITRKLERTTDPNLMKGLLDEVGLDIYTVCNDVTERIPLNPTTVSIIQLCLKVCAKVMGACIDLGHRELLSWMLNVIGKRAWAMKQLEEVDSANLEVDPPLATASDVKKQSDFKSLYWYRAVRLALSKGRFKNAKEQILAKVDRLNQDISFLCQQTALAKLQKSFGTSHVIFAPFRHLVKKQKMYKVSDSSKKIQEYSFFLFTDILIYANDKGKNQHHIHRVLHLFLCKLQPLAELDFRILSPQKSVTIRAPDTESFALWFEKLEKNIHEQRELHKNLTSGSDAVMDTQRTCSRVEESTRPESKEPSKRDSYPSKIDEGENHLQASHHSFDSSSLRLSAHTSEMDRRRSDMLKKGEWVCCLCLKKYGRRSCRGPCGNCELKVCKACVKKRPSKKVLCDRCFGLERIYKDDADTVMSNASSESGASTGGVRGPKFLRQREHSKLAKLEIIPSEY